MPGTAVETRLIVAGSAPLTEGFSLVGFEALPDATIEELDEVLNELLMQRQKALVLVEESLARGNSPSLARIRKEGGHIVVVEIPHLNAPSEYHPQIDEMILSILGPNALDIEK
jgi:vacuolar-type H+-ATPase subunit F/Vma7